MEKILVKVLDVSALSNQQYQKYKDRIAKSKNKTYLDVYDLDNHIISNNQILGIQVDNDDTTEITKYEMNKVEEKEYSEIKENILKYENLLNESRKNLEKFEHSIIKEINTTEPLYDGEYWDCCLSPLGRCIYHIDDGGELSCIFCGKPEERK